MKQPFDHNGRWKARSVAAIDNQRGSILLYALMLLVILTIAGFMASNTSSVEMQIIGNARQYKSALYSADGANSEVSGYVNESAWPVLDTDTTEVLTPSPATDPWPTNDQNGNTAIPNNTEGMGAEKMYYTYQVTYERIGGAVKGYGSKFAAYVFDVQTQNSNVRIREGYKKIGPKIS